MSNSATTANSGPWALVTGASDGIGAATARSLAEKGNNLLLCARRRDKLVALAKDLETKHGVSVRLLAQDLATAEGVGALIDWVSSPEGAGRLPDIAVLAAGFGATGHLADVHIENEINMLHVNCEAVLRLSHWLAQGMKRRGSGDIVLFGSLLGFQGNAMTANYSATKAYVQTLAEGLRIELAPSGVNVLSVAPGPIASGFSDRADMTMGQAGTPESVAKGIVRALGSSGTIRPGLLSKVLGYNMAMTPRPLRVRIMSRILSGMANRKAGA